MHRRLTSICTGALLLAAGLLLRAQTTAPTAAYADPPLTFDVVSVKENPGPSYTFMGVMDEPDGVHGIASLQGLIADAFGIRREFVSCKLPLCDKPVFDIRGKLGAEDQARFGKLEWKQKAALLQAVLKERFGLQTHMETRPTNVYDLVVAKGGSKLHPPDPQQAGNKTRPADGVLWLMPTMIRGSAITLDTFVPVLTQFTGDTIGRPVIDRTGLTDKYDIALKWSDPIHASHGSGGPEPASDPAEQAPGIFAALPEQLGLELKPAKEPVPTLVVDQAHTPTPD